MQSRQDVRAYSEMDMQALRRVGEALVLAQNRARTATARASRSEHLLRRVLGQIDSPQATQWLNELDRAPIDTSNRETGDWDMLSSVMLEEEVAEHGASVVQPQHRRSWSSGDTDDHSPTSQADSPVSSLPRVLAPSPLVDISRESSMILRKLAAANTSSYPSSRQHQKRKQEDETWLRPMQILAGVVVGVIIGWGVATHVGSRRQPPMLVNAWLRRCHRPARPRLLKPMEVEELASWRTNAAFEVS